MSHSPPSLSLSPTKSALRSPTNNRNTFSSGATTTNRKASLDSSKNKPAASPVLSVSFQEPSQIQTSTKNHSPQTHSFTTIQNENSPQKTNTTAPKQKRKKKKRLKKRKRRSSSSKNSALSKSRKVSSSPTVFSSLFSGNFSPSKWSNADNHSFIGPSLIPESGDNNSASFRSPTPSSHSAPLLSPSTKKILPLSSLDEEHARRQSKPSIPFLLHLQSDFYVLRHKPKAAFAVVCCKYFFLSLLLLLLFVALLYPIFFMFWKHEENVSLTDTPLFWAAVTVESIEIVMTGVLFIVLLGSSSFRALSIVLFMLYSFARFILGSLSLAAGVLSSFVLVDSSTKPWYGQQTLFYWLIPGILIHFSSSVLSFGISVIEIKRESITIARWKKLWREWLQRQKQTAPLSVYGQENGRSSMEKQSPRKQKHQSIHQRSEKPTQLEQKQPSSPSTEVSKKSEHQRPTPLNIPSPNDASYSHEYQNNSLTPQSSSTVDPNLTPIRKVSVHRISSAARPHSAPSARKHVSFVESTHVKQVSSPSAINPEHITADASVSANLSPSQKSQSTSTKFVSLSNNASQTPSSANEVVETQTHTPVQDFKVNAGISYMDNLTSTATQSEACEFTSQSSQTNKSESFDVPVMAIASSTSSTSQTTNMLPSTNTERTQTPPNMMHLPGKSIDTQTETVKSEDKSTAAFKIDTRSIETQFSPDPIIRNSVEVQSELVPETNTVATNLQPALQSIEIQTNEQPSSSLSVAVNHKPQTTSVNVQSEKPSTASLGTSMPSNENASGRTIHSETSSNVVEDATQVCESKQTTTSPVQDQMATPQKTSPVTSLTLSKGQQYIPTSSHTSEDVASPSKSQRARPRHYTPPPPAKEVHSPVPQNLHMSTPVSPSVYAAAATTPTGSKSPVPAPAAVVEEKPLSFSDTSHLTFEESVDTDHSSHHIEKLQSKHTVNEASKMNIFEKRLMDLRAKLNVANIEPPIERREKPHHESQNEARAKLRSIFKKYSPAKERNG